MNRVSEIKVSYAPKKTNIKITTSEDVYKTFKEIWDENTIEYLEESKLLCLNRSNEILGYYSLSKGGIAGTIIDKKVVFGILLKSGSSAFIICHNHPSGNLQPSKQDIKLTQDIKKASKLLDLSFLDHIIITKEKYYSLRDNGLL